MHRPATWISSVRIAENPEYPRAGRRKLSSTVRGKKDDQHRVARWKNNRIHALSARLVHTHPCSDCLVNCIADLAVFLRYDLGSRQSNWLFPRRQSHSEISGPIPQRSCQLSTPISEYLSQVSDSPTHILTKWQLLLNFERSSSLSLTSA